MFLYCEITDFPSVFNTYFVQRYFKTMWLSPSSSNFHLINLYQYEFMILSFIQWAIISNFC